MPSPSRRSIYLLVGASLCLVTLAARVAARQGAPTEADRNIRRLLTASGVDAAVPQFTNMICGHILESAKQSKPNLSPRGVEIVSQTCREELATWLAPENELSSAAVDVYRSHFTPAEVSQLLAFFDTPVGHKFVDLQPTLMKEVGERGRSLAQGKLNSMQTKMRERLAAEGIK